MPIIARIPGIELHDTHIEYNFEAHSIFSRVKSRHGITPIQHVNAIELTEQRGPRFLLFLATLSLIVALYSDYQSTGRYFYSPNLEDLLIPFGIPVFFFIVWLFWRRDFVVIYSEGTPFVEVATRHGSTDEFLSAYQRLKQNLKAPSQSPSPIREIKPLSR
jgi:hypothetical protein